MADILFDIIGDGTAYCIPHSPAVGETFYFYAVPDTGASLVDVTCTDDQGMYVAVPVSLNFSLPMPNTSYLTFHVEFTTVKKKRNRRMPIWMYPMFRT